jgi:hypothetical protein
MLVRQPEQADVGIGQGEETLYAAALGEATGRGRQPARRRPQELDASPGGERRRQRARAEHLVVVMREQEE